MSTDVPWADSAAQYKKDGELYSKVEYDNKGNPVRISVAQNQTRRGEFNMEGSTAVYEPHNVITLAEPGEEVAAYVRGLPFVQAVELNPEENNE